MVKEKAMKVYFIIGLSVLLVFSCSVDYGLTDLEGTYSNAIASISVKGDGTGEIVDQNSTRHFYWNESSRGKTHISGYASIDGWVLIYKQYDDAILYVGGYGAMIRD